MTVLVLHTVNREIYAIVLCCMYNALHIAQVCNATLDQLRGNRIELDTLDKCLAMDLFNYDSNTISTKGFELLFGQYEYCDKGVPPFISQTLLQSHVFSVALKFSRLFSREQSTFWPLSKLVIECTCIAHIVGGMLIHIMLFVYALRLYTKRNLEYNV